MINFVFVIKHDLEQYILLVDSRHGLKGSDEV